MSPRILLTTSRRPTRRTRSFLKDLAGAVPFSFKINRGKMNYDDIYLKALEVKAEKVAIVSVFKGNPGAISFYDVSPEGLIMIPPKIIISGVKLLREIPRGRMIKVDGIKVCIENYALRNIGEALSNIFSCEVFQCGLIHSLPPSISILHVGDSIENSLTLSFMNKYGLPIGPIIKVRKIIFNVDQ
ncbi:MAG: hypothetical protein J7J22_06135 [Candidatus Verstraetearchaeota archaeon]|nr:hypothetical protein [Candidatus Verstraetearchaeota archaeon]